METCENKEGRKFDCHQLEDWCQDFQHFFGWPVHIRHEQDKMVVEIEASKYNYGVLLDKERLHCVVKDKTDRHTENGNDWEFSFDAFAEIMMDILARESRPLTSKA